VQIARILLLIFLVPLKILASSLTDRINISADFYADNVGVYIISPMVNLTKTLSEHWAMVTSFRIDAITAASIRNGSGDAYDSVISDALTGASGRAGFEDVRLAPTLGMIYEGRSTEVSFGRYMSNEIDYDVASNYFNVKQSFNDANTVVTLGGVYSYEGWNPTISRNLPVSTKTSRTYSFSLTQLLTPKSYFQFRYSSTEAEGFLASPYHYLDRETFVRFDAYPNLRDSKAWAFLYVQQFWESVAIHGQYRYAWDDWDMTSHTVDGKLFYDLFERVTVGLKGRYYTQTQANFVQAPTDYLETDTYIASDYRLSALGTLTYGLSVSYKPESLEDENFLLNVSFNYFQTDKNNFIEWWYGTPQIKAFYMSLGIGYDF